MAYVDFFMLPLPRGNEDEYKRMAGVFLEVMKDFGLLHYCEAAADDVPHGKVTDFYRGVAATENETVVCAFAVWPDKKTRDHAWEQGMKDPRLGDAEAHKHVFDGKRMVYGGFAPLLEYKLGS
jgi:uncharacterized protein YbaA (DUF1428 family)